MNNKRLIATFLLQLSAPATLKYINEKASQYIKTRINNVLISEQQEIFQLWLKFPFFEVFMHLPSKMIREPKKGQNDAWRS